MKKQFVLGLLVTAASLAAQPTLNIVDDNGRARFSVEDEVNGPKPIAPMFVDKQVRNVETEKLVRMLAKGDGYLRVRKMSDGEYGLQCNIRGNGGGPILGQIGFWGVRAVGHGGLAVAYWFCPILMAEGPELHALVEGAAHVALMAGTVAPTM